MAARKRRRSSTRRRRPVRASNPKRHRVTATTTRRRRRPRRSLSIFSRSRRRANPVARRRSVRRRGRRGNPIGGGVIGEGFKLAIAGMIIGGGQKYVRQLVGGFLPAGPIANAGVTLATGYGLGYLAGLIPINAVKAFKRPLELAAWTLFGGQLVTSYLLPAITSVTAGGGMSGWGGRRAGVRGISAVTNVPPYLMGAQAATAAAAPAAPAGRMSGVSAIANRRNRY